MLDPVKAASILIDAHLKNEILDDIPADCKAATPDEAMLVQLAMLKNPKITYAGWKVALTNKALQEKAGVNEPAYGPIFAQFIHDSGHAFANGVTCLGGIECEFAVKLGKDLPASGAPYSRETVAAAIATLHPAVEVTGIRFKTRPALGRPGSTMDFAGNFAFVFGKGIADWRKFDLPSHGAKHIVDGKTIAENTGAFVLDHPLNSLVFLANRLATRNMSLKAGDWISTGAVTGPIPVAPGADVVADFGTLGKTTCKMPTK